MTTNPEFRLTVATRPVPHPTKVLELHPTKVFEVHPTKVTLTKVTRVTSHRTHLHTGTNENRR